MAPWLDFIFAKVICRANAKYYTVSIGLWNMLEKEYVNSWFNCFAAGAVLISIPIVILFMSMQNATRKVYQELLRDKNGECLWKRKSKKCVGSDVCIGAVCLSDSAGKRISKKEQWEYASTTPDGKYPELVTYTLGKMTGANNSNLPKGETYENNAYTRYLREYFNIQIRMYLRKRE